MTTRYDNDEAPLYIWGEEISETGVTIILIEKKNTE